LPWLYRKHYCKCISRIAPGKGAVVPSSLQVTRLSRVNLVADDYDAALARLGTVLGAEVLREWKMPEPGGREAEAQVGDSSLGVFNAAAAPEGAGGWLTAGGVGWHSLEWVVPSLSGADRALRERGIGMAGHGGLAGAFTRPEDLHGLSLRLTEATGDGAAGQAGAAGQREQAGRPIGLPLGITAGPTIKVASPEPGRAASEVARLVGRPAYAAEQPHLNAVGHGVRFDDHAVEFVGSASGADHDLIGGFLGEHGQRIFAVTYLVRSLSAARAALAGADVPFTQWGRRSLLLGPGYTHGARIELTGEI
jgi:hypothetical protein